MSPDRSTRLLGRKNFQGKKVWVCPLLVQIFGKVFLLDQRISIKASILTKTIAIDSESSLFDSTLDLSVLGPHPHCYRQKLPW